VTLLDLLHSLEILSELGVEDVGSHLVVLAVSEILLTVEEPQWDVERYGIGDHFSDLLCLGLVKVTCSAVRVKTKDLGLVVDEYLADHDSKAPTDALDASQSEGQFGSALDVGVEDTQDVLEFTRSLVDHAHQEINADI
jgi:hypothetical protein